MTDRWMNTIYADFAAPGGDVDKRRHPVTGQVMEIHTGRASTFAAELRRKINGISEPLNGKVQIKVMVVIPEDRDISDISSITRGLVGRVIRSVRQIQRVRTAKRICPNHKPRIEIEVERIT